MDYTLTVDGPRYSAYLYLAGYMQKRNEKDFLTIKQEKIMRYRSLASIDSSDLFIKKNKRFLITVVILCNKT